mmetsp:Transcript_60044/g.172361  ORF Transcript_60044/g.172361 Transcript_60044/m.172361 type:complete len:80 (-) Transcript_60044:160-399(-)
MLTGDTTETAIAIARSCTLPTSDLDLVYATEEAVMAEAPLVRICSNEFSGDRRDEYVADLLHDTAAKRSLLKKVPSAKE